MTPSSWLYPLCIVVEVQEVVSMDFLEEVIEDDCILERVVLLYKMPPVPVPLHMSQHRSDEGVSLLGGGVDGYGEVPSIHMVGVLFPPLSPEVSRMPGAVVTLLNCRSEVGLTSGSRYTTSLSWSRLALLHVEMIPHIRDEIGSFL